MLPMQFWPPASSNDDMPSAIVLSRLKDVVLNNNVLYRLVKPTETGTEVVSVNRLCNVVPHRRTYRFDRKDELMDFCNELLRRPLVIQPLVHFGRGLGSGKFACGMCYKDDRWVLLVNQTHPKILSRLQIGLDAAKGAIQRGQSFEIKFGFSKLIQQVYRERLSKAEQENAARKLDLFKSYFRYAEWEHGDLIIRYYGYAGLMGRGGGLREINTLNLKFTFEDLDVNEIKWKCLGNEVFTKPHMAPLTEDEIRNVLPEWTLNSISPLEDMGDQVPATNYSYAQAGRLYESFRKKKRQHARAEEAAAEEAAAQARRPTVSDGIELKVMGDEDERQFRPINEESEDDDDDDGGFAQRDDYGRGVRNQYDYGGDEYDVARGDGYDRARYREGSSPHDYTSMPAEIPHSESYYEERGAKPKRGPQYDMHGHLYPEVKVNGQGRSPGAEGTSRGGAPSPRNPPYGNISSPNAYSNTDGRSPYANLPSQPPYMNQPRESYGVPVKQSDSFMRMQGSDRSSRSEAVDSGIASDSDHVRENSDDITQYKYPNTQKQQQRSPQHPYAMDNPGFHHEDDHDVDDAMRKHKELIAKMMGGAQNDARAPPASAGYNNRHASHSSDYNSGPLQSPHSRSAVSSPYAKGSTPSPYNRSGGPSPHSPGGQVFDYNVGRVQAKQAQSPGYDYNGRAHSKQAQSPGYGRHASASQQQQVEESFI